MSSRSLFSGTSASRPTSLVARDYCLLEHGTWYFIYRLNFANGIETFLIRELWKSVTNSTKYWKQPAKPALHLLEAWNVSHNLDKGVKFCNCLESASFAPFVTKTNFQAKATEMLTWPFCVYSIMTCFPCF